MTRSGWIALTASLMVGAPALAIDSQAQDRPTMRFQGMDRNNDGVISRTEWRGSDTSFRQHDWNQDGVLSGDEVRPNARAKGRTSATREFGSPYDEYPFDEWTPEGFSELDHNRDNRITSDEWHFDRDSFRRADHNRDNVISRAEFLGEDGEDDDRGDGFRNLDRNNDGRIAADEWHGSVAVFGALDSNHDGYVTRVEMVGDEPPATLFTSLDVNRDGQIARTEWHWAPAAFDRLDSNHDGRLNKAEFQGSSQPAAQSGAYRAGYARGQTEGRAAGREDRDRNQGWDLDGQRELESADSGYAPSLGPKNEYQAGYRDAFRMAYREGWERR
jgi:Ca2+-binding EF-hand superfamily protein